MKPRHLLYLTIFFVIVGWTIATVQGNAAVSVGDYQQSLPLTLRAPLPTPTPIPTRTPPATPVPPAPPPAGTYGLLIQGDSIYRVDANGENLILLASHPGKRILHAEWSPDGRSFVYAMPSDSPYRFTYNLRKWDGAILKRNDFAPLSSLRWSPNGRWLFYLNARSLYRIDTYINQLYGSGNGGTMDYAISADSNLLAETNEDYFSPYIHISYIQEPTHQIIYDGYYVKSWLANNSAFLILRHSGEDERTGTWHTFNIYGGTGLDLGYYSELSAVTPSPDQNRIAYGRDNALYVIAPDSTTPIHTVSGGVPEEVTAIRWWSDNQHLLYESEVIIGGNTVAALSYVRLDSANPAPQRIGSAPIAGRWRDAHTISYSQLRPTSNGYACDPILYDLSTQSTRPLLAPSDACWQVLDWVTVP